MSESVFLKLEELREMASAISSPEKIQKIVDNYQQDTPENNYLVQQQYIDKNVLIELIQNNLQVAFVRVKHENYDHCIKFVLVLTNNSLLLYSMNEYLDHLHMDIELTEIIKISAGHEYDEIYDLFIEVTDNIRFSFQFNSVFELKKWIMLIEGQMPKKDISNIEQPEPQEIIDIIPQNIEQNDENSLEQEKEQQSIFETNNHEQMKKQSIKKNDPSILKLKIEKMMRIGFVFLKYGKLGNPHQRMVFVKDNLLICKDFNATKFKSISLKSINNIKDGRNSNDFKRFPNPTQLQEENSFIIESPSTTLSLEASNKEQKQKFISYLKCLMVRQVSFSGKILNQS